jgi:hypothetical protein
VALLDVAVDYSRWDYKKEKKKRSDGWMRLVWGKGRSLEGTKPRELDDSFG